MWEVDYRYIEEWLDEQDNVTIAHIFAALKLLEYQGPALGRPLVDVIKGTRAKNLKELRPASIGRTEVRILFVFDPKRKAVMLFAGDKSKGKNGRAKWSGWYKEAVPKAEAMYREYLEQMGDSDD